METNANSQQVRRSDLVSVVNGEPVTNSILVADKFGKQHKDVVRAIKSTITSAQNCANLFAQSKYADSYGRTQQMYIMNKDGFVLLVMGFTGKQALSFKLDYINAFNAMEAELRRKHTQVDLSGYVPIQHFNQLREMFDYASEQSKYWHGQVAWWTDMYGEQLKTTKMLIDKMPKPSPSPSEWMTVVGYATLHRIPCGLTLAGKLGKKATSICEGLGITPEKIRDPRFGSVNTYPFHVLEQVFEI